MSLEYLPAWITALCALLTLIFGAIIKILIGIHQYEKRVDKIETDLQHSNERQLAAVDDLREGLQQEERRRDELWAKLDALETLMGKVGMDVAYLRGQMEQVGGQAVLPGGGLSIPP